MSRRSSQPRADPLPHRDGAETWFEVGAPLETDAPFGAGLCYARGKTIEMKEMPS